MKAFINFKFAQSHEWLDQKGTQALIGISDHAQDSLGEIVFVDLPEVGQTFKKNDSFGAVESVKAASELYMPVSGTVVAVNHTLLDHPNHINETPYDAWMIEIEISDPSEVASLYSYEDYESMNH